MKHATITEATYIDDAKLRSTATPGGRPLHRILVSFSAAYFVGALVTDLVYWEMPDVLWERFSIWLIMAGLVTPAFPVFAYIISALAGRGRRPRPAWPRLVGYALAVFLAVINAFVHSRDG